MLIIAEFDFQGSRWWGLPIKKTAANVTVEFAVEGLGKPKEEILRCPLLTIKRHIRKRNVQFKQVEVDNAGENDSHENG
jgi:hypothetical protein